MKRWIIVILGLFLAACGPNDPIPQEVDIIGQGLAAWANVNCRVILVNGQPVTFTRPEATTCDFVYFRNNDYPDLSSTMRQNLNSALQGSTCNRDDLITYLRPFADANDAINETPAALAGRLSCMGNVTFQLVQAANPGP